MSNYEYLETLFKLVYKSMGTKGDIEHYLTEKIKSSSEERRIFKAGGTLLDGQEDFKIEPTDYEILISIPEKIDRAQSSLKLIYKIGNVEVSNEYYTPVELINLFKHENISRIKIPDKQKIFYFLKIYRLLNQHIDVGRKLDDLASIYLAIGNGEWVEGRYYQEINDEYNFLEVEKNGENMKKLTTPSLDHLVYCLAGGGNIGETNAGINERLYNMVLSKMNDLTANFNKEFLMCLMSFETGIENYAELENRYNRL